MDGNTITSAVGSQKLINFQQLMVVGGKGRVFFLCFGDYVGQHNYMAISGFKSAWCLELCGYSLFLACVRDIFIVVWRMCVMECMKQTIYEVPKALNTLGIKFFILVVVFGAISVLVNHLIHLIQTLTIILIQYFPLFPFRLHRLGLGFRFWMSLGLFV